MAQTQGPTSNKQYQCPQCLWTGTAMGMEFEHDVLICPNCKVEFDPQTWPVWDYD